MQAVPDVFWPLIAYNNEPTTVTFDTVHTCTVHTCTYDPMGAK